MSASTPLPFPNSEGNNSVFTASREEMEVEFAEEFTKLLGRFLFCINRQELAFQLDSLVKKQGWKKIFTADEQLLGTLAAKWESEWEKTGLEGCDVAITGCEALVARTGSIVMSAREPGGRTTSVYAPVHICIAYTHQLRYDIRDALQLVKDKYGQDLPSLVTFATGPSRTADIEKTLVVGVHGPKEVYLFLVEQ